MSHSFAKKQDLNKNKDYVCQKEENLSKCSSKNSKFSNFETVTVFYNDDKKAIKSWTRPTAAVRSRVEGLGLKKRRELVVT